MGYATSSQKGQGLHLRQYARAFVFTGGEKLLAFVTFDGGLMSHSLKRTVVQKLQETLGKQFTMDNVMICASHSHSCPSGYLQNVLYELGAFGYVKDTYKSLVNGIVKSIRMALKKLQEGHIFIDKTKCYDLNTNRSPTAFLQNPKEERDKYKHNTDKTLIQLRLVAKNNKLIGAINWFPIHPTSMNNTNRLVSTDNVGYAAILLEQQVNVNDLPGQGEFVATFAPTNLGDVSPNIKSPKCEYSGKDCDRISSSCPIMQGRCIASGPGRDQFESTKIIGTKLSEAAWKLMKESKGREVTGKINFIHQFVDVPKYETYYCNYTTHQTQKVKGCLPAMGYSSGAGTTDGPGAFFFNQGNAKENFIFTSMRNWAFNPSHEDLRCQEPKSVILPVGEAKLPYQWQPSIVPTQIFLLGDVLIAGVSAEFTTMSGRRLRKSLRKTMHKAIGTKVDVIVATHANMYSSYVTTPEEYQIQRYEGGATCFGPYTLPIYIDQFTRLWYAIHLASFKELLRTVTDAKEILCLIICSEAMAKKESILSGPNPPFEDYKRISTQPNVIFDGKLIGTKFGGVLIQPKKVYGSGNTVNVAFVGANPRNDLRHGKTYLTVEREEKDGNWTIVANDSSWETKFVWKRTNVVTAMFGHSVARILWEIPDKTKVGNYRIRYFCTSKPLLGKMVEHIGTSNTFAVIEGAVSEDRHSWIDWREIADKLI
ncbi:Neutral ceramidase [Pseudolycoriella hygida]|uniref:Neutral ceramidase n=1 Tax=Pseudolycoriella hygida TaxID=35572 RepID=A0A9Q0RWB6_9DIPT|nr:Neutral ceramidase [Pseudolycoriella hygida]